MCQNTTNFYENSSLEKPGFNSRCVRTYYPGYLDYGAYCFEVECVDGKVRIFIDGVTNPYFECTSEGQKFTIWEDFLEVVCPSTDICKSFDNERCLNNCNGNGRCLEDNSCLCNEFFGGADCSEYIPCGGEVDSICGELMSDFVAP